MIEETPVVTRISEKKIVETLGGVAVLRELLSCVRDNYAWLFGEGN